MKPLKIRSKREGRSSFSLNGDWDIAPAHDEDLPRTFPSTIRVPSVVDCARPSYDWKSAKYHCYRKRFSLEIDPAEFAFLKIGQSQFGTDVWVDGKHAGGSISCYTSHEHDITGFLEVGRSEHEIIVRVGRKENLPKESAVGIDHEKEVYTPGIWGDVSLTACGSPRISVVQMIPDIQGGIFRARITIDNLNTVAVTGRVTAVLSEKKSVNKASELVEKQFKIAGSGSETVSLDVKIATPHLWSPQDPFLYDLHSAMFVDQHRTDKMKSTCGLREFRIDGRKFLLNEKQIFLKGGNIAFHRFLADQERGILPWDRQWIQRVLIDIPKEHQFNFFRNHLGQLYPAWYDIADEGGMLIQNEWHFWGVTGSEEQITKEFTQWLKDNWNHPSIIIWDALNECSDEVVQKKVVPKMKTLDPTRPWESVDFIEQHPYIYSLGPVINKEKFGFTEGIPELENWKKPVVLNEFNWCWVNKAGEPTKLMDGVTERWLGPSGNGEGLLAHQSFLVTELVELFRRIRADAIQPFVYLSNNEGPTAHWFRGPIADLNPKPILAALKNAFSPIGVSIELWDRHFVCGERRMARIFVLNDEPHPASGILSWGVSAMAGEHLTKDSIHWDAGPGESSIMECEFQIPDVPGTYTAVAVIQHSGGSATSNKIIHAVNTPRAAGTLQKSTIAVLESGSENLEFFRSQGLNAELLSGNLTSEFDILVVGEGLVRTRDYDSHRPAIEKFLAKGGTVVVLEPELGLEDTAEIHLAGSMKILLKKREDKDKGGYDSYVFPEETSHPIFNGLSTEHFHMFNGGFGGEMVSQHDMETESPHSVLARCGLHLRVCALVEAVCGSGRILVSRIQTRGRLVRGGERESLYRRRVDPVAQQYMLNLLSYAAAEPGD